MNAEPAYRPAPLVFERLEPIEQRARLGAFRERMQARRTVRHYSSDPIPDALIDEAIAVAGSAPSGANLQPWQFVVVRDPEIKRRIRLAAEAEERAFYEERAPAEWIAALAPLGTDAQKPFLEAAPCLIVVFRVDYGIRIGENGDQHHIKHYYAGESVGIACGFLLAALHIAGLATLTHTPSPMAFLASILVIPVGFPAPDAVVPSTAKKPLDEIRLYAV